MGGGGGCCIKNCCIGNIIGKIKEFFGSSSGSSSGGRTESYQADTADLQATLKVQNALTEFRTDTQSRSARLENEVVQTSRKHLDAFIDELKKYNKIKYGNRRLNINLSNIERENRKTEDKIHGFIVKRVSKRISLDDDECLKILKMDAGKKKEEKLDEFYQKVLKEAVIELTDELRTNMETQTDTVCERIQQRIDSIVDVCETKTEEFEHIRKVKESDEKKIEQEQLRLSHFVALCEYGLTQVD